MFRLKCDDDAVGVHNCLMLPWQRRINRQRGAHFVFATKERRYTDNAPMHHGKTDTTPRLGDDQLVGGLVLSVQSVLVFKSVGRGFAAGQLSVLARVRF